MYKVCKADLVMLCFRGKAHKTIRHIIAEKSDVEWLDIKKKLMYTNRST